MTRAILTYHSIDDSGSPISLATAAFAAHVEWLTSGRVRTLPLGDLVAARDEDGDAVAVTFDDGYVSSRAAAARLLDHGVPVTIFVVSGHVGGTNAWAGCAERGIPTLPLLGWGDLELLGRQGAGVETHTRSHAALEGLSADRIDEELRGCQSDLETRLGIRSQHVAYPYGAVDDTVAAHAATHFRFGHTTDYRLVASTDDPMRLPRLDMYYFQRPGALDAWGTPGFARRVAWVRARRQIRARIMANG